jgi:geranylgeranyl diphosphate synthase, type II
MTDREGTHWDTVEQALERRLQQVFGGHDPVDPLGDAMRAAVLGPRTRLESILLVSIARDIGYDTPSLLDVACAIAIVQAAAMVLAGLPCKDDRALRRGVPALHRRYGEDVTVLAAVSLFSQAFTLVAGAEDLSAPMRMDLVAVLAQTIGAQGLFAGQCGNVVGSPEQAQMNIDRSHALKTGALLCTAIEMAAIVAQSNDTVTRSLRGVAAVVGQAYQIRDELPGAGVGPHPLRVDATGDDTGQESDKATLPGSLDIAAAGHNMGNALRLAQRFLEQALGPGNRTAGFLAARFPQLAVQNVTAVPANCL